MYEGQRLSGQRRGFIFLASVVIVFMQGGLWSARRQSVDSFPDDSLLAASHYLPFWSNARPAIKEHPISKLMADAENSFREKLSRQSQTFEDAVREYERRYKRKPPRGFDNWWKFAQDNDVLMLDEYDNIHEDLAPFWEVSGEDLRSRASLVCQFNQTWSALVTHGLKAGYLPHVDVVRVRDGKATAVNVMEGEESVDVSARAKGFLLMLKSFQEKVRIFILSCPFRPHTLHACPLCTRIADMLSSFLTWSSLSMQWLKAVFSSHGNYESPPTKQ